MSWFIGSGAFEFAVSCFRAAFVSADFAGDERHPERVEESEAGDFVSEGSRLFS